MYVSCTDFTFVEDGIFWDVYAVECAVVEDAAGAELGERSLFVEFEVTIYEDAAVAEVDEVGQCSVLKDCSVGEVSTGTVAAA